MLGIVFFLIAFCVGWVIFIWIMAVPSPQLRRYRQRREPACGQCGYLVRGLPTFICPECGADFREVGIEAYRRRWWQPLVPGPFWAIAIWSLSLFLLAYTLTSLVGESLPFDQLETFNIKLYAPRSGSYQSVDVYITALSHRGWGEAAPQKGQIQSIEAAILTNNGSTFLMRIDAKSSLSELLDAKDGEWTDQGAFGLDTTTDWFQTAGIPTENQQVQVEISEVVNTILVQSRQGLTSGWNWNLPTSACFQATGSGVSSEALSDTRWFNLTATMVWAIIWGLVCWYILRRFHRAALSTET